ncbi:MAG: hypothetical protein AAF664_09265 [Planctomycetota bacterium]
MKPYRIALSLLALTFMAGMANAQSTIAPRSLDLTFGKSFWGSMLPGYDLGPDDGDAFTDDQDSLGAYWELAAIRRVLNTRTSFEARSFFGYSWANQSATENVNIINPIGGGTTALSGGAAKLNSDTTHYGFDLAILDTWRTDFGGLSAGLAFSYMAFDQDFDARYAGAGLFEQELDQDFIGGKGILGWEGCLFDRPTSVRASFGYYNLDADYGYEGLQLAGVENLSLADHTATVEVRATRWYQMGDWYTGWTLGGMYIEDFAQIDTVAGTGATLVTDDAATAMAMVEILL